VQRVGISIVVISIVVISVVTVLCVQPQLVDMGLFLGFVKESQIVDVSQNTRRKGDFLLENNRSHDSLAGFRGDCE
jgi:hypothetical protein